MITRMLQTMLATSLGGIFPAFYLYFQDILSDPMKLLGALALIVQIGYVSSKTYIVWRNRDSGHEEFD